MRAIDITGQRFGRWLVTGRAETGRLGHLRWHCQCDCGTKGIVFDTALHQERSRSCGCLRKADSRSAHPLYVTWKGLRYRCASPRHHSYEGYGGRGITVCARWESFDNFLSDMGDERPPGTTLDRIDNDGPYSPENCRWATLKEQASNRRPRYSHAGLRRAIALGDTETLEILESLGFTRTA